MQAKEETIFSKIIRGEIPCDKVFENERILAFKDIAPQAPVHLLIIPKTPIINIANANEKELEVLPEIFSVAKQLAKEFGVEKGYRLITNNGTEAGQTVFHLHFHLLGGRTLGALG